MTISASLDHDSAHPGLSGLNGIDDGRVIPSHNTESDKQKTTQKTGPVEVSILDAKAGIAESELIEQIIHGLKVAGGCIVRNLFNHEIVDEITKDLQPYLKQAGPWDGDFWPPESRTVAGLLGKSERFALDVVGNRVWQGVVDHFLTSTLKDYWVGPKAETSVSKPQLNNSVAFLIGPGARDQVLHRDDIVHHNWHELAAAEHRLGQDTGLSLFVACTQTTRANGATRFVPGSHLWAYGEPAPVVDDDDDDDSGGGGGGGIVHAELGPGDAFMMLSGVYHGGSANTTQDQHRLIVSAAATRGYLRQEENQYLAHDLERIRRLPVGLQRFAGYAISEPFMGWVDVQDPLRLLDPDAVGEFASAGY